jgi:hypothetical protein
MHGKPMTKTFRALMIALLALPMALQAYAAKGAR